MILFLFLSHLGVGIMATLVFVSREAGVKFFRFNAGLAAILIAVALAFRYQGLDGQVGQVPPAGMEGAITRYGLMALVVAEAALLLYWATVGRALARVRPGIAAIAVGGGLLAVVLQAAALTMGDTVPLRLLTAVSFVSSAALLGSTCTAMILGHWYLVIPSLQGRHLQSIVTLHIASLVFRIVVVGAAVFAGVALWEAGPAPPGINVGGGNFRRYITSVDGIFFWQRVLFGLAGPVVLSYLTWETAKIRSTQSATGILYVDFFTVVVGEVLAKYLVLATRVPL
jgi:protein NrfD